MRDGSNDAYIFLGSNVDRDKNYLEALRRLAALGQVRRVSSVYETAPIGSCCEYFYNGAARLATPMTARELKRALRRIEAELGRVRRADRNAPRTIDLDLALFNQERRDDPYLPLPDPLILERPFMAQALAELNPGYMLPGDGRTLAQIAASLRSGGEGQGAGGQGQTRIDRAMTARVRELMDQIHIGETTHA